MVHKYSSTSTAPESGEYISHGLSDTDKYFAVYLFNPCSRALLVLE